MSAVLRRRGTQSATDGEEPAERRRIAGERPRPSEPATRATDAADEATTGVDAEQGDDSTTRRRPLDDRLASLRPDRAQVVAAASALLVGVVVGAVLTGLVYAGMQGFQAIYHTPAGGAVGAVVLLVVLVAAMLTGRFLLGRRRLPDPGATSLLGIMLMVIGTLGLLLPVVFSVWMLAITPALGGLSYLVSHLLIAHFGDRA